MKAPRRKKGLVNIPLTYEKLLDHRRAGPGVSCLLGGFETVKGLDEFLDEVRAAIDRETGKLLYPSTVGWTNLEVIAPSGVSFYQMHFGGALGPALRDLYVAAARRTGHPVASFDGNMLTIDQSTENFPLDQCQATLHNVWERSLSGVVEQQIQGSTSPPSAGTRP